MVNSSGKSIIQNPEQTLQTKKSDKSNQDRKRSKLRIAADILESIDDYVSAFDRDWNFIYINKTTANFFGCEPKELIGKNFWQTFPKFVGTVLEKNYRETMSKREIRRFEWKTIYAHTGFREFTVFPSAEGITVYGVDITERKQLQQKLEEYAKNLEKLVEERTKQLQDKERLATIGETAGMVGHDIRNPLQSIVSSMYLIKSDLDNLPESDAKIDSLEELNSILEQIKYVDKIVSDLQDYARPLRPELVEVDIKALVTSALSTLNVPDNVEASAVFDEKLPRLRTDPLLLKRVLLNLATNAIQAMPEGGKLTIKAQTNNAAQLQIIVEDTGVGIPEEIKPKLFTPLFITKSKGQGFGLAVCKRVIEAQGGTISFESQVGQGTKFIIHLPAQSDKAVSGFQAMTNDYGLVSNTGY